MRPSHLKAFNNTALFLKYLFIWLWRVLVGVHEVSHFCPGHVGSLVAVCELSVAMYVIYFSDQGWNPGSLLWECWVLATGPPGKSLHYFF